MCRWVSGGIRENDTRIFRLIEQIASHSIIVSISAQYSEMPNDYFSNRNANDNVNIIPNNNN